MLEKARNFAAQRKWNRSDEILYSLIKGKERPISAALLLIKTLRARDLGEQANTLLVKILKEGKHAAVQEWSEYAEELIQSGIWKQAGDVIRSLKKSSPENAAFLRLCYCRETEDWSGFAEAGEMLSALPQWRALVDLQTVRAELFRGRTDSAGRIMSQYMQESAPAVRKIIARWMIARGNLQDAEKILEDVRKQQPLDWEVLSLLALCVSAHNAGEAAVLWDTSLRRQPRQAETCFNRARWHVRHNRLGDALRDCEAALAVKPWFDNPLLLALNILIKQDPGHEKALACIHFHLKRHVTPLRLAARLDVLRGQPLKADRHLKGLNLAREAEAALRQYPGDPHVLLAAGAALQVSRKPDRALHAYGKRLEILPGDLATRNNMAQLHREQGELETAVAIWKEAEKNLSDEMRINLASALQARGDSDEAESIYAAVLKRNPESGPALRGMADVLAASGSYDAAWKCVQKALSIDSLHCRSWILAASIKAASGKTDEQAAILGKAETIVSDPLPIRQALFRWWRSRYEYDTVLQRLSIWADAEPGEPEYHLMMADIYHDLSDFENAEQALKRAQEIDWQKAGAALVRFYEKRERSGAARRQAKQMLRRDDSVMKHYGLLSEVLYRQERYKQALDVLDSGLRKEPCRLSLVRQKVGQLLARENFSEAVETARQLVDYKPVPPHISLLLNAFSRARMFSRAIAFCRDLLDTDPENRMWNLTLARMLAAHRQIDEAVTVLERAREREPYNLQIAEALIQNLIKLECYDRARAIVMQVIESAGEERPDGVLMLAFIIKDMGDLGAARDMLAEGTRKYPSHLGLWKGRVDVLKRLHLEGEAKQCVLEVLSGFSPEKVAPWAIGQLVALDAPETAEQFISDWHAREPHQIAPLWASFGLAQKLSRFPGALRVLDEIEKRRPGLTDCLSARSGVLDRLWRMDEAIAAIRKALQMRPDSSDFLQRLLNLQIKVGDFDDFNDLLNRINRLRGDRRYALYPAFFFNINCHPDWSAEQIYAFYRDWYRFAVLPNKPAVLPLKIDRDPDRILRIGYVSPDFRAHAVGWFSDPLLRNHDRDQFELFAFAHFEHGTQDQYTERFKGYFDHWTETAGMGVGELEKCIKDLKIDILIDLAGHTSNNNLPVFIRRPAPVQATWVFGAGQTTGLPEIDYFLTDAMIIPPDHERYLAEQKVMRLPFSGLPHTPPDNALDPVPLPCLENGFVTFGILARPLRTNKHFYFLLAEILRQVPDSRLRFDHIPYAEPDIQNRIFRYFADELDIDPQRLVFLNTRPHWRAFQEIDIQFDTFPAGSGTVITEGLWMERPAVTLKSRPPMGMIGAAQLTALGLDKECCAETPDEYISKAVALALDYEKLELISAGLRERMKTSTLMDYHNYARETAVLYRKMWQAYCSKNSS